MEGVANAAEDVEEEKREAVAEVRGREGGGGGKRRKMGREAGEGEEGDSHGVDVIIHQIREKSQNFLHILRSITLSHSPNEVSQTLRSERAHVLPPTRQKRCIVPRQHAHVLSCKVPLQKLEDVSEGVEGRLQKGGGRGSDDAGEGEEEGGVEGEDDVAEVAAEGGDQVQESEAARVITGLEGRESEEENGKKYIILYVLNTLQRTLTHTLIAHHNYLHTRTSNASSRCRSSAETTRSAQWTSWGRLASAPAASCRKSAYCGEATDRQ